MLHVNLGQVVTAKNWQIVKSQSLKKDKTQTKDHYAIKNISIGISANPVCVSLKCRFDQISIPTRRMLSIWFCLAGICIRCCKKKKDNSPVTFLLGTIKLLIYLLLIWATACILGFGGPLLWVWKCHYVAWS